jgi:cytochrome c peroxidase
VKILIIFLFIVTSWSFSNELITPVPEHIKYNHKKAELGKYLFFDPSFSQDGKISCASCHNPSEGWADRRPVSLGVFGRKGDIQSPTVLNSVFNFKQFWNGRADTLAEQINGPAHNPVEMGMNNKSIEKKLNHSALYSRLFKQIYHTDKITYAMFADAIAEFEKALITPDSKFDLYLKGKSKLSGLEMKGYVLFKKYGCITCHNGVNVGGNSFQKMGIIFPIKKCVGDRYEVTHNPFDKCVYKVPTLRNIELTAPYFHSASASNLSEAVQKMAYNNLGFRLSEADTKAIVAFLKTLTGKTPEIVRYTK